MIFYYHILLWVHNLVLFPRIEALEERYSDGKHCSIMMPSWKIILKCELRDRGKSKYFFIVKIYINTYLFQKKTDNKFPQKDSMFGKKQTMCLATLSLYSLYGRMVPYTVERSSRWPGFLWKSLADPAWTISRSKASVSYPLLNKSFLQDRL